MKAIISLQAQELRWPTPEERERTKALIQRRFGIPSCIGYIDGTHVNLEKAPVRPDGAASFFSRKKRYGMLLLAAVDHRKRFIFAHHGFSSKSSDMRAQQATRLHTNPEEHFGPGEYLLGDSGFMCTTNIIPFYKKGVQEEQLRGQREYFNRKGAPARVDVEHAFGIVKGRWEFLRSARLRLKTSRDEHRAILVILACLILHNLFIATWQDHISPQEPLDLAGDELPNVLAY